MALIGSVIDEKSSPSEWRSPSDATRRQSAHCAADLREVGEAIAEISKPSRPQK
jgi:hypothetical protein